MSLAQSHERASRSAAPWLRRLFEPVDGSALAVFRIAFYAIMVWEAWRMHEHRWIERYFTSGEFHFTYWPFDFVTPWPGAGMTIQLWAMAFCALCAALGLFYRVSAAAFFLMMSHFFLIEQARYLNHLYLVCLLALLMVVVPAHRVWSLDALRRRMGRREVPAWSIWLLRFQVAVPYFFGGIAKLNHDWLRGEPLRDWLSRRMDFPLLGPHFADEWMVMTMAYGALLIDLAVPFLLLWRRTRVVAFSAALIFHLMNARLFDIGIFPWAMIAVTTIFFAPDWPRRFLADLRSGHPLRSPASSAGFVLGFITGALLPGAFAWPRALIGGIGTMVLAYHLDEPFRRASEQEPERREGESEAAASAGWGARRRALLLFLLLWVAYQVLMPLRHLAIPGNVHWTEEGHLYAWHMKLRHKDASGIFTILDPATGETWKIRPERVLTRTQARKMLTRPVMVVQFAHYLERRARRQFERDDLEVRAEISASLNGRRPQLLIDPEVDLTGVPYPWFGHAEWILPLEAPVE